ncbi:hypothetical protein L9F63_022419 [Diploptera punctata]|uniref:Swi5-dependent recombination DNA repair protein 1 homolog n=1 Tax=Diploptera punctata TaxID=6984 RepID=A0AAD8EAZ6_DIPPU|nr:hypothetical protein L9F63_022419 [Diploptera punctata]
MDSISECQTPKVENAELFSPPITNTPRRITLSSSKGLLTPCRQVGLRRRSLKSITSPATSEHTSFLSPVANGSKYRTTPEQTPLKKHCKSSLLFNNNSQDENDMEGDNKSNVHNSEHAQLEDSPSKFQNLTKHESTYIKELPKASSVVINDDCKYSITQQISSKKHYAPRCKRSLKIYRNYKAVGQCNTTENKSNIKKTGCTSSSTKDGQQCSTRTSGVNDYSHIIKTVPFYGEIKDDENPVEKMRIMKQYVKEKEEQLRLLKLAKLYRKKHDPEKLHASINKWKEICKSALYKLQEMLTSRGQSMSMAQLLAQFGISHDILQFNPETDDFE